MTDFILKSNKELTAFLKENEPPPQPESWVCPNCGATNYSLFFSRSTKCAECKQYTHPPLEKDDTKTQMHLRNEYLRFINSEISRHQNEIDDLINEINDIKEEQHSLEIERQEIIDEIKKIKEQEEKSCPKTPTESN